MNEIPHYLESIGTAKRLFGTLKKTGHEWVIKAEPQVMEMVRRVFKATSEDAVGEAAIPDTRRFVGEMNWFMMRYPLKILSLKEWENALRGAQDYVIKREILNIEKHRESTPVNFKGKLYEFQEEGLSFLLNNERCLLADEMGLGKTVEALAFVCKNNKFPILIVVPPHLLSQWQSEIKKFLGEQVRTHIISGLTPYQLPDADIYLIHYLLLRGWFKKLLFVEFDAVIFDEVQELRHPFTQKYDAAIKLAEYSKHVKGLSGTPIYNYGIEIFSVMDAIDKACLGTKTYFMKEWCEKDSTGYLTLVKRPDVLGSFLREEGLLLRRHKDDVLKELPPKRRAIQPVGIDEPLYIQLVTKSYQLAKEIPIAEDKMKGLLLMEAVNNTRRATGIAKSRHVAEYVKFLLDSGEPCLLFAYHHDVMALYNDYLKKYNPLFLTGAESKEKKQRNVDAFMQGDTNLLIINLRTTSGLNLQRARVVVFGELDWSPAVHTQAEDRVHRMGQKDSVLSYYLVTDSPSDMEILNCLGLKSEQFGKIMHDKERSELEISTGQVEAQKFMWNIVNKLIDEGRGTV